MIREGKRLFGKYGLKKTNIAQLTEAAGISPAAFYKFFASKEELYFFIFEKEALNMQNLILEQVRDPDSDSTETSFRNAFATMMNLYKEEPFLERLFLGSDLNQLMLSIAEADINAHVRSGYRNFTPAFESLQKEGKVIPADPEVLITIMQLFFLLNDQRSHFDPGLFDQAMNLLARWIARGLTSTEAPQGGTG
ncbi:TetR/AcrR family transcriptional regulator [Cohnella zeiphila]|uniref:TetR/AcrR family transcriptional regulator n=1 Tax=Cohnella zeiphila TaxID=2761120 RepID=A0A7X0SQL6_9BACL|nr:TetR/AcrR family transcriptional regulator [Cohnella zeiphila]MBB6734239.1 TetR/AcrR family transcriptional regulator [Cohnella zeiphila]